MTTQPEGSTLEAHSLTYLNANYIELITLLCNIDDNEGWLCEIRNQDCSCLIILLIIVANSIQSRAVQSISD